MESRKAKCGGYGMFTGIYWVVGLGLILGALLGTQIKPDVPWEPSQIAALAASGIALAFIALSVMDWFVLWRALAANPLPDELDLSSRQVASEQLAALKGCSLLHRQVRRLLAAWSAGASGPQVAAMANSQMLRTLVVLAFETVAIFVLLGICAAFGAPPVLLTLGTGFMVLVLLLAMARAQLASHMSGYIESHLLARIGNDTPAAAGTEFAQNAAKSVGDSMAALATAQTRFADQLAKSQEQAAALAAKAQQEAVAQIAKAQAEAAAQIAKAQADMSAKLVAAQEQSTAQLSKAQTEVATQLGRVTALASSIDNVLKLQQAVDGTLKGVTVTDEFKSTLLELKRHLAESDSLLKNVSKPRAIRLVETTNE